MPARASVSPDPAVVAVSALTRRVLLPLAVFGATVVLLASVACGEYRAQRMQAALSVRADGVVAHCGPGNRRLAPTLQHRTDC
jgi:hypothetical protein